MEMTTKLIIDILEHPDKYFPNEKDEAIDQALTILRKYQKLERYMSHLEEMEQYGTLRKFKIALGEDLGDE